LAYSHTLYILGRRLKNGKKHPIADNRASSKYPGETNRCVTVSLPETTIIAREAKRLQCREDEVYILMKEIKEC